eukprot:TRINITY_DN2512_c0_g1_i5.p3 TRINITY_DN2512_c0_g1~~TRINITY_DN2512_c0_g1_i5.p3  ORF type:complete len:137 (+),score=17.67 TRINITY_DN2512_c0_g1_i5:461-871(+)
MHKAGTPIEEHNDAAICAACGTATCSNECHTKYATEPNLCSFHTNFHEALSPNQNLRSIRLKVIKGLQKRRFALGTPVTKTSKNFLYAGIGRDDDEIILQRGYRQYGEPHELTMNCLLYTSPSPRDGLLSRMPSSA